MFKFTRCTFKFCFKNTHVYSNKIYSRSIHYRVTILIYSNKIKIKSLSMQQLPGVLIACFLTGIDTIVVVVDFVVLGSGSWNTCAVPRSCLWNNRVSCVWHCWTGEISSLFPLCISSECYLMWVVLTKSCHFADWVGVCRWVLSPEW